MSERFSEKRLQEREAWESSPPSDTAATSAFIVDLEGFEGPLDLLLELARSQKVDLACVSILALVEQYLNFIRNARWLRLKRAADYLVMAAWLAYLKSRLLLPQLPADDAPSGAELADALAFRLRRLEAMRAAGGQLWDQPQLGRDVFARGMPETISVETVTRWDVSLYDLLSAYGAERQRSAVTSIRFPQRRVLSLVEAREILGRLIGRADDWMAIDDLISTFVRDPHERATAVASTFSASLELAKEGVLELRQTEAFRPLYVKRVCKEMADIPASDPPPDGKSPTIAKEAP